MRMKRTTVAEKFKYLALFEVVIALSYFVSRSVFLNLQVAFLSSFFVIVASGFTHKKLVKNRLKNGIYEDDRDLLEKIDDPHGLFEEEEETPNEEEVDFKEIVKEEKKRVKPLNAQHIKTGLRTSFSLYRLGAYLFLVMGFIALKNNAVLNLGVYLPSLALGIVAGYLFLKEK